MNLDLSTQKHRKWKANPNSDAYEYSERQFQRIYVIPRLQLAEPAIEEIVAIVREARVRATKYPRSRLDTGVLGFAKWSDIDLALVEKNKDLFRSLELFLIAEDLPTIRKLWHPASDIHVSKT